MKKLHNNQSGLVAFMVVMVIMIVLSLIVLAFAKLVNREQRQTLDRQLNTQAFYAAESGVNDARQALAANPALANTDYTECTGPTSFPSPGHANLNTVLDGPGGVVSYSCLLVDPSPRELVYSSVPMDDSITVPIRSRSGAPITDIQISWEDSAGQTNISGCPGPGSYPDTWRADCQVGMLRLELVPFNGGQTRQQLITGRGIAYVTPRPSGGTSVISFPTMQGDNQGLRHPGNCSGGGPGPRLCGTTIRNFNMTNGYLRLRSLYRTTAVTIRGYSGSSQQELVGAQAEVDSTGRASDVLKRIKMNVPIGATSAEPGAEYALQIGRGVCKMMELGPNVLTVNAFFAAPNGICNPRQPQNQ